MKKRDKKQKRIEVSLKNSNDLEGYLPDQSDLKPLVCLDCVISWAASMGLLFF